MRMGVASHFDCGGQKMVVGFEHRSAGSIDSMQLIGAYNRVGQWDAPVRLPCPNSSCLARARTATSTSSNPRKYHPPLLLAPGAQASMFAIYYQRMLPSGPFKPGWLAGPATTRTTCTLLAGFLFLLSCSSSA